ncbi:hypothetical protein [Actinomadura violacea]|uniref:Uncharacterized protein n=1 Tax=Actinomadura violacea TaxID=2819934 RepID=A0ABS3S9Q1_9ACTN|nr:hypothetical protein [Actinomadura violacea]MBO2464950.1 hypothetical protein [Actinomadura violacea]
MTLTTTTSAPDRRPCSTGGPSVRQHWGTPITVVELTPAPLLSAAAADIDADGPPLESLPPGDIITDLDTAATAFRASFDALADAYGPDLAPPISSVDIDVQVWRHGHDVPATGHPADLVAWWILAASPAPTHTESGALAFSDPRAGSQMTAMPGLPWGRQLMIRPVAGAHVAAPGWLTSSIVPLEHGQYVLVAIAASVR